MDMKSMIYLIISIVIQMYVLSHSDKYQKARLFFHYSKYKIHIPKLIFSDFYSLNTSEIVALIF
jgi:hypothetical protein